jgi:hypothetical protein
VSFDVETTAGGTSANCKLVYGNNEIGRFKRTMLRTALAKLPIPRAPIGDMKD